VYSRSTLNLGHLGDVDRVFDLARRKDAAMRKFLTATALCSALTLGLPHRHSADPSGHTGPPSQSCQNYSASTRPETLDRRPARRSTNRASTAPTAEPAARITARSRSTTSPVSSGTHTTPSGDDRDRIRGRLPVAGADRTSPVHAHIGIPEGVGPCQGCWCWSVVVVARARAVDGRGCVGLCLTHQGWAKCSGQLGCRGIPSPTR